MRLKLGVLLGFVVSLSSACQHSADGPSSISGPSATDKAAATDGGSVHATAANCSYSFSGGIWQPSPVSLQGSATTSCTTVVSDIFVQTTIQRSSSANGPWQDVGWASRYGGATYSVSAIASASVFHRYYYRVIGYHRWSEAGTFYSLNTVGYPSWVP